MRPAATLVPVGPDPLPADDERSLVDRARHDADAFAELYRRYLPRVHAYAHRRTGDRQAAEDITSATFEAVLRGLPDFRWRAGGIAPWIFRIAANQTAAHHRRVGRERSDRGQQAMARLAGTADPPAAGLAGAGDDTERLRSALDQLSLRYQRAIGLRYLAGLDNAGAARAMGLTGPAYAVVLSRARSALARALRRDEQRSTGERRTQ